MKVEITCKNYRLDEPTKSLIEKKLAKFDKYFDKDATAKVKLSTVGDSHNMEICVSQGSLNVRSLATGEKMNENIVPALIVGNKSVSLAIVEPFYRTAHCIYLL